MGLLTKCRTATECHSSGGKRQRLFWLCLSCVSARGCPTAAFSPEASLNQKRLVPLGFNSQSCRSFGERKKKTDKNSLFCLCFPLSSLCPHHYKGGKWSKRLQGAVAAEPDMEGVYCSAIKQNKKQKYAVWRRALANSRGKRSRGQSWGVCVCGPSCAYTLFVQEPSGIQSPSDIMKIILLITMETLIKTEVCNYSGSVQNNRVSGRMILHTDSSGP